MDEAGPEAPDGRGGPAGPRAWARGSAQAALGVAGFAVLVLGLGGDLLSGNPSLRIGSAQAFLSLAALPLLWAADRVGRSGDRPGSRARLVTAWRSFLTVSWCALLFGVAEVVLMAIRRDLLHRLTWTGSHYAWTTTVSWLAILLPVAVGFAATGFAAAGHSVDRRPR